MRENLCQLYNMTEDSCLEYTENLKTEYQEKQTTQILTKMKVVWKGYMEPSTLPAEENI